MGDKELVEQHIRIAESGLAQAVSDRFPEQVLATLWAAEQLRRTADERVGELLEQAHRDDLRVAGYTWEELGSLLGMSPQGARQRMLRRRRFANDQ